MSLADRSGRPAVSAVAPGEQMWAVVHDPRERGRLSRTRVDVPQPAPDEVLVAVHSFSLNYAEIHFLAERFPAGARLGLEASGVVVETARDGSGPALGTRVTGFAAGGAWAEYWRLPASRAVPVPAGLDPGLACCLPAAGVTALQAVRRLGDVSGRRVAITGATGGVGRFTVQLAASAGAQVIAVGAGAGRTEGLTELGAHRVLPLGHPELTGLDLAIDLVGGPALMQLAAMLRPGGLVLSAGMASGRPSEIDFEMLRNQGGGQQIVAFTLDTGGGLTDDLETLLGLAADGSLVVPVAVRRPWTDLDLVAADLVGRRVNGKAVLDVV